MNDKASVANDQASVANDKASFAKEDLWSANHKVKELTLALHGNVIVDHIWKTLFTEEGRQRISADDTMGPDIIDIWAKFKGVSEQRAVAELAREVNLLSDWDFRRLLRSLGEEAKPVDANSSPVWDKSVGELRLGSYGSTPRPKRDARTGCSP